MISILTVLIPNIRSEAWGAADCLKVEGKKSKKTTFSKKNFHFEIYAYVIYVLKIVSSEWGHRCLVDLFKRTRQFYIILSKRSNWLMISYCMAAFTSSDIFKTPQLCGNYPKDIAWSQIRGTSRSVKVITTQRSGDLGISHTQLPLITL